MYNVADSKHNATQSINITQQDINRIRTEHQQIYNSQLPLTTRGASTIRFRNA